MSRMELVCVLVMASLQSIKSENGLQGLIPRAYAPLQYASSFHLRGLGIDSVVLSLAVLVSYVSPAWP